MPRGQHWLKRVEIPATASNFDEISHHSLQGKGYNEFFSSKAAIINYY